MARLAAESQSEKWWDWGLLGLAALGLPLRQVLSAEFNGPPNGQRSV